MRIMRVTCPGSNHRGGLRIRVLRTAKKYFYALGSAIYMFTIGMRDTRERMHVYQIADWHGYPSPIPACTVPEVEADEISDPKTAIEVRHPIGVDGNVPLAQLVVMMRLIRTHDPQGIFEIGTFDGRTTLNMAANAGDGARIITLDLPAGKIQDAALPTDAGDSAYSEKPASGARFANDPLAQKITQLYGDSATFDYGPYNSQMDFVFIDGSHSYEYVLSDTDNARKLLRGGKGWILWDDYGVWEGVTRALNELHENDPDFAGMLRVKGTPLALIQFS